MCYVFPRIVSCDYHRFGTGGEQENLNSICILALNIINDKVFLGKKFCQSIILVFKLSLIQQILHDLVINIFSLQFCGGGLFYSSSWDYFASYFASSKSTQSVYAMRCSIYECTGKRIKQASFIIMRGFCCRVERIKCSHELFYIFQIF